MFYHTGALMRALRLRCIVRVVVGLGKCLLSIDEYKAPYYAYEYKAFIRGSVLATGQQTSRPVGLCTVHSDVRIALRTEVG